VRHIVAVSGGVDSVALLDMVAKKYAADQLVVAHFDHGIRETSADDAKFVQRLAAKYKLPFETKREELGADASEELARHHRYAFLRAVAKKHNAKIMTAHHADDMVETIAINLTRGTGWRGLAVLDSPDVERPLLHKRKAELIAYANTHNLKWREDATNADTKYLRNDIRKKLSAIDDQTVELLGLYHDRQRALKRMIDADTTELIGSSPYSRYFFGNVPDIVAIELLRAMFIQETGTSPTILQRRLVLHALKTAKPGKRLAVIKGVSLRFTKTTFVVEQTSEVLL
jgi:tRNA(Ile)-lysidine synthase